MPVAPEGQDQNESRDYQQAGGFQGVDLRCAVMSGGDVIGRSWIRLPFWTGRGHGDIVAPEGHLVWQKELAKAWSFREPP